MDIPSGQLHNRLTRDEFHQLIVRLHIPAYPTLQENVITVGRAPHVVGRMLLRQLAGGIDKAKMPCVEGSGRNRDFFRADILHAETQREQGWASTATVTPETLLIIGERASRSLALITEIIPPTCGRLYFSTGGAVALRRCINPSAPISVSLTRNGTSRPVGGLALPSLSVPPPIFHRRQLSIRARRDIAPMIYRYRAPAVSCGECRSVGVRFRLRATRKPGLTNCSKGQMRRTLN